MSIKGKGPGSKLQMPKHSRGFQKNIILDDPNVDIKLVTQALTFKESLNYTISTMWDGTETQVTFHSPGPSQLLAAVEIVRELFKREIADLKALVEQGKPPHGSMEETLQHIKFLEKVNRDSLYPFTVHYTAAMINDRKDAPKPMMAVVKSVDKKK